MSETNDAEDVVEIPEMTPVTDDEGNDSTDWKALAEERQALALKALGTAKRYKTKLEKFKDAKPEAAPVEQKESKSNELDYGQKAFLRSYDIKGADELELVKTWTNRTGEPLDSIVEDEIFQAKLKNLRDVKASANAIPKGPKRSNQPAGDDFEAAYAKYAESGELPEDRKLRERIVDAKIDREKGAFH